MDYDLTSSNSRRISTTFFAIDFNNIYNITYIWMIGIHRLLHLSGSDGQRLRSQSDMRKPAVAAIATSRGGIDILAQTQAGPLVLAFVFLLLVIWVLLVFLLIVIFILIIILVCLLLFLVLLVLMIAAAAVVLAFAGPLGTTITVEGREVLLFQAMATVAYQPTAFA